MIHINITKFVLINYLEKYLSMIETRRLKNVVVSIQTISIKSCMKVVFYIFAVF